MLESHREALRQIFKLPRPTVRQTAVFAGIYIAQAIVCIVALKAIYSRVHWLGALWAMISAVLALQPGTAQSLATSVVRILANAVGAIIGYIVGRYFGQGTWQLLTALTLVVIVCETLRLDLALRTACVAVLIVLTANEGNVRTSSLERFSAVLIGCVMAMAVQVVTDLIRDLIRGQIIGKAQTNPHAIVSGAAEQGKQSVG